MPQHSKETIEAIYEIRKNYAGDNPNAQTQGTTPTSETSGADEQATNSNKEQSSGATTKKEKNGVWWWIRLKDNFFSERRIKNIMKSEGKHVTLVIYIKLLLTSAKEKGTVFIDVYEGDTLYTSIAEEIDEEPEDVERAITTLKRLRLVELANNNESEPNEGETIKLLDFESYVGALSNVERKRLHDAKKRAEAEKLSEDTIEESNEDVTDGNEVVTASNAIVTN